MMRGWQILDNTFVDCQCGILLGGGRDNVIRGNTFVRTDMAIHFDDRGLGGEKGSCDSTGRDYVQGLNASMNPAWAKYGMAWADLCTPVNNTIEGNSFCQCPIFVDVPPATVTKWKSIERGNTNVTSC